MEEEEDEGDTEEAREATQSAAASASRATLRAPPTIAVEGSKGIGEIGPGGVSRGGQTWRSEEVCNRVCNRSVQWPEVEEWDYEIG